MMAVGKPASKRSPQEATERLLVQAAQKDPSRFAELYEDNFERVYAFIVRRVRDRTMAEDLCADVFYRALANLGNFDWRGIPFAAWLLRIAANLINDQWRRSAREELVEDLPDHASSDPSLQELEQRARLFRMVQDLPAEQRRVIQMRFAEGKSVREIAREIGRSAGAVKQLQFRGLRSLRTRLEGKNA
jgi:RNA polymerase sigma-70 factor (ECF subfamily)